MYQKLKVDKRKYYKYYNISMWYVMLKLTELGTTIY